MTMQTTLAVLNALSNPDMAARCLSFSRMTELEHLVSIPYSCAQLLEDHLFLGAGYIPDAIDLEGLQPGRAIVFGWVIRHEVKSGLWGFKVNSDDFPSGKLWGSKERAAVEMIRYIAVRLEAQQ